MYFKRAALILVLLILTVYFAFAQIRDNNFRHLTTKQGLPSNSVNSIMKDKSGFMWIGTENGLARYDGYTFITYPIPYDPVSESESQAVNDLFEDREGNFWVGTLQRGLLLFDRKKLTFTGFVNDPEDPNSLSHNTINIIYQDRAGTLWIGTYDGGLNKFDAGKKQFTAYRQGPGPPGNQKDQIFAILEDRSGRLWVGTGDGAYVFDRQNETFTGINLGEIPGIYYRRVTSFVEDNDGMIWIGTYWGLCRYNAINEETKTYLPAGLMPSAPGKPEPESYISNIFIESISKFETGKEPVLWIATQWGLNRFDTDIERFIAYHHKQDNVQSISTNHLKTLYLDDAGLLWIGTTNAGLDLVNTSPDHFHEVFLKLPGEDNYFQAASFLQDQDETIWIGGVDAGLFHYDKNFNLIGNYKQWNLGVNAFDERQHNKINCIYEDPDHNLWLGYYLWGLVNFDREHEVFRHVELRSTAESPAPGLINNILKDRYGILWVGTESGLFCKNKSEDVLSPAHIIKNDELASEDIISIFEDKKRNLWISTRHSGLFCLEPDHRDSLTFRQFLNRQKNPNGFTGNYISTMYEDTRGTLWFGSDRGLSKYIINDKRFEPDVYFNANHGGHIIRIFGDSQENIWLLHASKGLIRYQPHADKKIKVKVYDNTDGLPFDNFNTLHSFSNVFYQSNDGRLYISANIGTEGSFFWFHPDSIGDNTHIPPVMITGFRVGNQSFPTDSNIAVKRHITLKHDENFFSFEFAALDFFNPEKNQYAYYLEGLEEGWVYSGHQRFANYTGVPPGEYTFRVKGSNNDGYWNEEGASVHISVSPPFWKTSWAFTTYGIVFFAVIYSIIHYYLRRQRLLQNLAFRQMESEKLKELDSLKTIFFTNISHEFRTPLTLILGPVQQLLSRIGNPSDQQALTVIQHNAIRLKELVNQLLSLSKLESGKMQLQCEEINLVEFVRNYIQSFESLAMHRNISLDFVAGEEKIPVFIDKEKMCQVLNNLLSNAFKFTPEEGRIEVGVVSRQSSVISQLKDATQNSKLKIKKSTNDQRPTTNDLTANCATISISDTGPGIPPEKLPHIFDRFYQVDDSMSREQEGTGIGLAIVKEMINLHHGHIEVESRVGAGTTFRISLPAGRDNLTDEQLQASRQLVLRAEPEGSSVVSRQSDVNLKAPRANEIIPEFLEKLSKIENAELTIDNSLPILLIVEDNPDMRSFIRGYFEDTYQIIESGNGLDGLDKATKHIPDIIISDVMMPKMDGYEMSGKLKRDERTSHIPIILLTARASKESRIEGLETGADDFVTKPFDGEELQARVKNLVDQRKKWIEHFRKEFETIQDEGKEKILSMEEKFLQKAKTVVEKNLSDPEYGVERFAADMAMSRSQLHRKLSALVDQSITGFIRTIRLNYAVGLLKNKTGNISEIAYDAGFNNPTYFSISFKKQFGISPKEFLARMEKKN